MINKNVNKKYSLIILIIFILVLSFTFKIKVNETISFKTVIKCQEMCYINYYDLDNFNVKKLIIDNEEINIENIEYKEIEYNEDIMDYVQNVEIYFKCKQNNKIVEITLVGKNYKLINLIIDTIIRKE